MTVANVLAGLVALGLIVFGVAYFLWRRRRLQTPADSKGDTPNG
jgi:hypothetical protein